MKLFEIPMVVASLFGFGLLVTLDTAPACADFVFGEPEKTAWPYVQSIGCVSYDGLEMYVEAFGAQGGVDLCVRKRTSKEEAWGPLENLGPLVNTAYDERAPSLSGDGLTLYFWSQDRPDGYGSRDSHQSISRLIMCFPGPRACTAIPCIPTSPHVSGPHRAPSPFVAASSEMLHCGVLWQVRAQEGKEKQSRQPFFPGSVKRLPIVAAFWRGPIALYVDDR